jgi:hypothetical protein
MTKLIIEKKKAVAPGKAIRIVYVQATPPDNSHLASSLK